MRDNDYRKTVTWILIAALLNLLLIMTPSSMAMANSQKNLPLTISQTPDPIDIPCHTDTSTAPHQDPASTDVCSDSVCDDGCTLCLQVSAGIPTLPASIVPPERETFTDQGPSRLDKLSYGIIPPPPKPFSN
jgi:hypothetical protein